MFLTFKCHVYIKKCFIGILITLVNSHREVKWIHDACEMGKGQRGEADKHWHNIVIGINGNITKIGTPVC